MTKQLLVLFVGSWFPVTSAFANPGVFEEQVVPILARHCLSCHNDQDAKGGLSLATATSLRKGGDSGAAINVDDPASSLLLEMIRGENPEMPKDADALSKEQIASLRAWIESGAEWPDEFTIRESRVTDFDWWSLQALQQPAVPELDAAGQSWARTSIDAFIYQTLRQESMLPAPEADRRTLIRRLYFDLIGLPPSPEAVDRFVKDDRPGAYQHVVDELLESPRYGERWARHWLDVVHYGDTHGYDKDKLRANSWPYRDYVVRSFNEDKPYARFVREQLAGDVLWPDLRDGIEATGFISAGPWDFIGHAEVPEEKIDGQVARNLDRDDMVSSTMNTFLSSTVQCARCHNHKFDPVTQEQYYSLQAVFAALDRADRSYDRDPEIAAERRELMLQQKTLQQRMDALNKELHTRAGGELKRLDEAIAELRAAQSKDSRAEFGYHSQIAAKADEVKWVQVDLGQAKSFEQVIVVGSHDDFNGIGAGFGFPLRFRIQAANDPEFKQDVVTLVDQTGRDFANPGTDPQLFRFASIDAQYIRFTATKLALRKNDYILALGEMMVLGSDRSNIAAKAQVSAFDSIEAPARWRRSNLVDGFYRGVGSEKDVTSQLASLIQERQQLLDRVKDVELSEQLLTAEEMIATNQQQLKALPEQQRVYVGTVHSGSGAFRGRGHLGGKPRDIHLLIRGEVTQPGQSVGPGTIPIRAEDNWRFSLEPDHSEGERRVALADWVVHHDNPLTWRSIVNRVWLYHFGRGIVDSPNDFGRMGQLPTHPKLLDWMAVWFRDQGQSWKELHRLIVTSSVYRQSTRSIPEYESRDAGNRFLWRMNRRSLEAEVVRDSVLSVSGKLRLDMYGPGFRDFVLERPEHSPHYEYHKHDPSDPATHRRSVYRFLVRSQQQPFMQTLDCADPSQSVAKRDTTITAIQALTLMNNKFMVQMSKDFSDRLARKRSTIPEQVDLAYQLALNRDPEKNERDSLTQLATEHGLANVCRVIFNLNEFLFVD
ncbi:MAG: DUF1553 domain-containing protein [Planctomycetaceae bacterium]|nr:DUF1553 domain-containing protein [Planctomycetaceae bacterium]